MAVPKGASVPVAITKDAVAPVAITADAAVPVVIIGDATSVSGATEAAEESLSVLEAPEEALTVPEASKKVLTVSEIDPEGHRFSPWSCPRGSLQSLPGSSDWRVSPQVRAHQPYNFHQLNVHVDSAWPNSGLDVCVCVKRELTILCVC